MKSFQEIETEVQKTFETYRAKEKAKPKHQLILKSLNEKLVNSELNNTRWQNLASKARANTNFTQLCGYFLIDYALLLRDKATLELNHFLEPNKDSININFFLNILENKGKGLFDKTVWRVVKQQIQIHRQELYNIKEEHMVLIRLRDTEIAHNDKNNLGNKYDNKISIVSPEMLAAVINKLKPMLDYYYELFNLKNRETLEGRLSASKNFGFETGFNDLVSVVNFSFEKLVFDDPALQRIAEDYKFFK